MHSQLLDWVCLLLQGQIQGDLRIESSLVSITLAIPQIQSSWALVVVLRLRVLLVAMPLSPNVIQEYNVSTIPSPILGGELALETIRYTL